MSLADIHVRAERFQARIVRRNLVEYAAAALVIAAFAFVAIVIPDPLIKAGCVLVILGALYVVWRLATMARAASQAEKAQAESWADFHRAELARQRDALRTVWRWYLAPFAPGALVFLAGVALAPGAAASLGAKALVFATGFGFLCAVFVAIGWINALAANALEREIDALDRARRG